MFLNEFVDLAAAAKGSTGDSLKRLEKRYPLRYKSLQRLDDLRDKLGMRFNRSRRDFPFISLLRRGRESPVATAAWIGFLRNLSGRIF